MRARKRGGVREKRRRRDRIAAFVARVLKLMDFDSNFCLCFVLFVFCFISIPPRAPSSSSSVIGSSSRNAAFFLPRETVGCGGRVFFAAIAKEPADRPPPAPRWNTAYCEFACACARACVIVCLFALLSLFLRRTCRLPPRRRSPRGTRRGFRPPRSSGGGRSTRSSAHHPVPSSIRRRRPRRSGAGIPALDPACSWRRSGSSRPSLAPGGAPRPRRRPGGSSRPRWASSRPCT
mmetsp:Transcript_1470/g.3687  ORF Transcript_1470/g.3687 Transcript_1470/m.3687 type:complete len:234 (-) Transcript_1470:3534-4235(-)